MAEPDIEDLEADTSRMIPGPPAYSLEEQLLPLERRSPGSCWAWSLLVTAANLLVLLLNFLVMGTVFTVVLLPTVVVVYFGFQCHSRVFHSNASYCKTVLDDSSSSALIILGFVIMSPLIVLAMAIYCSLARRFRLFLCFQPYARAIYKGVKWRWYQDGGLCGCAQAWNSHVKAWV
ncbi:transmembrane protein 88B [Rhinatrema bivittatum]|uniref:transmembrane protein 88B n=1 Tax=Rhinatrema bivittatum TaxID=194408 RepID=UPI00112848AD|nr:transmembrane protein 88B [Rhinatrema bivittatum]